MTGKERYDYRKENGLCVKCGKEKHIPNVLCESCLEKQAKSRKEIKARFIERRISNKICVDCGKPNDSENSKYYCKACNEKRNKSSKETYKAYQKNKVCPMCRINKLFGDEKICVECRVKDLERHEKLRKEKSEHYNNVSKISNRKLRTNRKINGLCVRCGNKLNDLRYSNCEMCRQKENTKKRIQYIPKVTGKTIEGLCINCSNPVKEGYKVCEHHYQILCDMSHSEKASNFRKEQSKKYWKNRGLKMNDGVLRKAE